MKIKNIAKDARNLLMPDGEKIEFAPGQTIDVKDHKGLDVSHLDWCEVKGKKAAGDEG